MYGTGSTMMNSGTPENSVCSIIDSLIMIRKYRFLHDLTRRGKQNEM